MLGVLIRNYDFDDDEARACIVSTFFWNEINNRIDILNLLYSGFGKCADSDKRHTNDRRRCFDRKVTFTVFCCYSWFFCCSWFCISMAWSVQTIAMWKWHRSMRLSFSVSRLFLESLKSKLGQQKQSEQRRRAGDDQREQRRRHRDASDQQRRHRNGRRAARARCDHVVDERFECFLRLCFVAFVRVLTQCHLIVYADGASSNVVGASVHVVFVCVYFLPVSAFALSGQLALLKALVRKLLVNNCSFVVMISTGQSIRSESGHRRACTGIAGDRPARTLLCNLRLFCVGISRSLSPSSLWGDRRCCANRISSTGEVLSLSLSLSFVSATFVLCLTVERFFVYCKVSATRHANAHYAANAQE